jgi:HD superfamily phosphohydrolase
VGEFFAKRELEGLLTPVDVIRDPVHGDVRITSLERFIIDTPAFQRLRNINQLALTYVAYPGAVHNRFIHSVGTLYVCSEMIATCNKNANMYGNLAGPDHPVPIVIPSYCTLVARLCALLHDMAHVPFGHTLEKEGRVFEADEWQDKWRYDQIFGVSSDFTKSVVDFLLQNHGIEKEVTTKLLQDVATVLRAKKQDVQSLPFPFIHDLVGNTICADLVDYIQRDMHFCGLTEAFGDRFLNYLAVMPTTVKKSNNQAKKIGDKVIDRRAKRVRLSKPTSSQIRHNPQTDDKKVGQKEPVYYRLVLLQYRYNEKHAYVQKHDVISEAIDLVRKRLAVAEKLYYHRTKVAASSMLIAAAHDARLEAKTIWDMSDTEVLKYLEKNGPKRARVLAGKLLMRHLLKPLFVATFHEEDASAASNALWEEPNGVYARFSRPENRVALIEKIEQIIAHRRFAGNLERAKGTVTVSCPSRDMSLKAFEMLVLPAPGARIIELQHSVHRPTKKEIEAIIKTHENLWRLEVFVDPDVLDLEVTAPSTRILVDAVQSELCVANEIPDFRNASSKDLNSLILEGEVSSVLTKLGVVREKMRVGDYEALSSASYKGDAKFQSKVKQFLIQKGYLPRPSTPIHKRVRVRSR